MTPLNIDTMCKDGKSKTIINKYKKDPPKELTEEERMEKQVQTRLEEYSATQGGGTTKLGSIVLRLYPQRGNNIQTCQKKKKKITKGEKKKIEKHFG